MATRQLTAPEALRELARRLGDAPKGSYLRKYPFLCVRVSDLRAEGLISFETRDRIHRRIDDHLEPGRFVAYWNEGDGSAPVEPRILAALWMAHELEEEDEQASRE